MAITTVPTTSEVLIKVGDGASPETFAQPCLINMSRSIEFTHSYQEDEIPDCDSPANPDNIVREIRSKDFAVTGSGKLNAADIDTYVDWAFDGTQKNAVIQIGPSSTGRTVTGAFYCQFSVNGEHKGKAECTITLTPVDVGALTVAAVA